MSSLAKTFSREAKAIESNLERFDQAGQQMGEAAQAIGAILIQVKEDIPHGKFEDWLGDHWSRTPRMARKFMQFAKQTREIECVTPALLKSHWTEICHPKRKHASGKDPAPQRTYDARTPCPRCKGTGYIEGGPDIIEAEIVPPVTSKRFRKPTPEMVSQYAESIGFKLDGGAFCDFYESKGWVIGKSPMKSWQAAVRTWKKTSSGPPAAVDEKCRQCGQMADVWYKDDTNHKVFACRKCQPTIYKNKVSQRLK